MQLKNHTRNQYLPLELLSSAHSSLLGGCRDNPGRSNRKGCAHEVGLKPHVPLGAEIHVDLLGDSAELRDSDQICVTIQYGF